MSNEGKTYNGWTNYETWVVNLWLDNEERSQGYWAEVAREAYANAKDTPSANARLTGREPFTAKERASFILRERLKSEIESWNPLAEDANMWTDLLNGALSEINWQEIARHCIDVYVTESPDKDQAGAQGMELENGLVVSNQHTPGPWTVEQANGSQEVALFIVSHGQTVSACYGDWPDQATDEEQLANANLIAAAPDLLIALEAAELDLVHLNSADLRPAHQCTVTNGLASVRDAIKKAKGLL